MMHVFLSHAKHDERATRAVCNALEAANIPVWVSLRDIPPGANWDESIEAALEQAVAVVLVVSPSSVLSRYVRTEVEWAIRHQKTVIPIVLKPTTLPVRWGTLQYVKWDHRNPAATARAVARGLPQANAAELDAALHDSTRLNDVRDLILRHTEWLPIEFCMAPEYIYKTDVSIVKAARIDCFAGRLDTIGPRAYLYYLGSPYHKPIYSSGKPSPRLRQMLNSIRAHCCFLRSNIPPTHQLAPQKLFRRELESWRKVFSDYRSLKVHVIVGRRDHYRDATKDAREAIVAKLNEELFPEKAFLGSGVEMMSYDRILDGIRSTWDKRHVSGLKPKKI